MLMQILKEAVFLKKLLTDEQLAELEEFEGREKDRSVSDNTVLDTLAAQLREALCCDS